MVKLKSAVFFIIFVAGTYVFPQSGWIPIMNTDSSIILNAVKFFNQNTGIAAGYKLDRHTGVILRTTNSGISWQRDYFSENLFADIYFVDNFTGYAVGDGIDGCVFKTTNGGVNWFSLPNPGVNFFKVCFYNANTGIVADKYGGEIITTNGGQYWTKITGFDWDEPRCLICLSPDIWILSGWNSKINKTTNRGINWTATDYSGIGISGPGISFLNSTTGFCVNFGNTRVFKTTDSGSNWTKICDGFGFEFYFWGSLFFINESTGYVSGYSNTGCVAKTTNGGYNWFRAGLINAGYIYSIDFINYLTGFACGDKGGVFKTTNGGSVFVSNISNEVPEKFELGQNYPNPFNQFSIIDFKFQMKSNIVLKVYDAEGGEVQTLVNETLAPGTYQVRFDGSGLASGVYYYKLSVNGENKSVRKMVLIK